MSPSKSPTDIETRSFVVLRSFQVAFAFAAFVAGCVESARWILVFSGFFPILVLCIATLLDTCLYYKKRYARGAGSVSLMRTLFDWAILVANIIVTPFIFFTFSYSAHGIRYRVDAVWAMFAFTLFNICFYFATAVMLSVEDARMRKWRSNVRPSATEAMPSDNESTYHGHRTLSHSAHVEAVTALTVINNLIRNGYSIEQLTAMGDERRAPTAEVPTSPAPSKGSTRPLSFEPGPPHYKA